MRTLPFPRTLEGKLAVWLGSVSATLLLLSLFIAFAIKGKSGVIEENPFIIILNLVLNFSGIFSLVLGVVAAIKYKEWLVWKYLVVLYSFSILLFLIGEFLFPH